MYMQRIIIILIILAIACFALAGVINKFEKRLKQKSAQRTSVPPVSSSQTVQQRRMSAASLAAVSIFAERCTLKRTAAQC
jgi:flagellar basal body-associated protein FliL